MLAGYIALGSVVFIFVLIILMIYGFIE